ncbi:hypothetical protein [Streptomyces anulatus]|uniref:hypothetical protein n=1 Tax=Streptomyces anulatus TaxID=1892 RepID=UPI002E35A3D5|nr:hypothetical protein [Streptomyces anulatus]WSU76997.1 hypothetical protein OG499_30405 [Streptomyces anulatus]WTD24591.1 hypothetical protein OH737_08700 [Streptomyces anulatus]
MTEYGGDGGPRSFGGVQRRIGDGIEDPVAAGCEIVLGEDDRREFLTHRRLRASCKSGRHVGKDVYLDPQHVKVPRVWIIAEENDIALPDAEGLLLKPLARGADGAAGAFLGDTRLAVQEA